MFDIYVEKEGTLHQLKRRLENIFSHPSVLLNKWR